MGASKRKQLVNGHAKAYVDAVFAERLREEGFINLEDRSLCWYRVQNKEIINMVCFTASWNKLPLILSVGYGIHPLFSEPYFVRSVYITSTIPFDRGILSERPLFGPFSQAPYSDEILVCAPGTSGRGLEMLDDIILPEMKKSTTIEDCYNLYKEWVVEIKKCYKDPEEILGFRDFMTCIDTGIYLNDTEMYPLYDAVLEESIEEYKFFLQKRGCVDLTDSKIDGWELRRNAMTTAGREEYLAILERRKAKNIAMLKKKFGIVVG